MAGGPELAPSEPREARLNRKLHKLRPSGPHKRMNRPSVVGGRPERKEREDLKEFRAPKERETERFSAIDARTDQKGVKPRPARAEKGRRNPRGGSRKGNWTAGEDEMVVEWVKTQGATRWTECARGLRGRCGKQCRERWVNVLSPGVKRGSWSEKEQAAIFNGLAKVQTSWSAMSKMLPGRTENSIKNYFYSSIRRLKANPLTHLLKDIHVERNTPLSQVQKAGESLSAEIAKLNPLSAEICRFLLDAKNANNPFTDFLVSVLFVDCAAGQAPRKAPASLPAPASRSEPPALLPEPKPEECRQAFEQIRKFVEKNENLAQISGLLKTLDEQLARCENSSAPGKVVTLKIPFCWNCSDENCSTHTRL